MQKTRRLSVRIAVLQGPAMPGLARLAVRQGWPVLRIVAAGQAVPLILRERPDVVIVQVPVLAEKAAELIRLLRSAPRRIPILAVAGRHEERIERMVRAAGATCYLPSDRVPDAVEQTVAAMAGEPLTAGAVEPLAGRRGRVVGEPFSESVMDSSCLSQDVRR